MHKNIIFLGGDEYNSFPPRNILFVAQLLYERDVGNDTSLFHVSVKLCTELVFGLTEYVLAGGGDGIG